MAIVFKQKPQAYTPAYNKQIFVALSNQIAYADFYYIVTVQVNGGAILTENILQRPDGHAIFDVVEKVKNYIKHTLNPIEYDIVEATDNAVGVEVIVKEHYSGAVHSSVTYSYIAWNACLNDNDFRNFDYLDYVSTLADIRFLSINPFEYLSPDNEVSLNSDLWIYFFVNSRISRFELNLTDPFGVPIIDIVKTIPTTNKIVYTNIGRKGIDEYLGGVYCYTGCVVSFNLVEPAAREEDPPIIHFSGSYTFVDPCTNYIEYNVYYLKRNGSFGFKRFNLLSSESESKKVNKVRMNTNLFDGSKYSSNVWDRENNIASTILTKTITLNSNWITENQSELLSELFSSPLVWIQKEGGDYIPVSITDTSYNFKKHINESLFNYTIQCEYDIQETRQRAI